jgi:murein DD-endopeptidase MepM/ murein hydrolase activator NlpD
LHKYCAHLGVDLAADAGSPIKATSDGVIEFAGNKENYGKVVIVAHHQYSTLYAHLSRVGNIRTGSSVKQGTVIGYLGSTGLSTGPHVHYEFRVNGVHYDPQNVKLPHDMIANASRSQFLVQARTMTSLLDSHHNNPLL